MNNSPLLRGQKIRLAAIQDEDIPSLSRWSEDIDYMRLLSVDAAMPEHEGKTREIVQEWRKDKAGYSFGIRLIQTDQFIGTVSIFGIMWTHGSAWLGIGIGSPSHQNKGYGREAVTLALDFAFRELNLHRVQLSVFSYNMRGIHLYESLGFAQEATYREALHRDGQRHNMLIYGILRREWEKS